MVISFCKVFLYIVEPQLSNDSQVEQFRVQPKHLCKKCFCDCINVQSLNAWVELMKRERVLTEKTNPTWLNTWPSLSNQHIFFFNKSVVENNFGMSYIWQPRCHYIYIYIYIWHNCYLYKEMNSTNQVWIQDKAVYISFCTNIPEKGMNPSPQN